MGFLKELFEKKLNATGGAAGPGGRRYDEPGFEVGRSAQSEWSLPAVRGPPGGGGGVPGGSLGGDGFGSGGMLLGGGGGGGGGYGNTAASSDPGLHGKHGGGGAAAGGQLLPQASAKSFSYAAQRQQQVEAAERADKPPPSSSGAAAATAATSSAAAAGPASVKYESLAQFSQRVELYRGSVATVFKALCAATGARVILKAYHKAKMHPKHHAKLAREIAAMRALAGPLVAELYAVFEDAATLVLVMEYCEGGDLFKTMLMHGGLLDEQWVCVEVIAPLLRALERMHAVGWLHRDIKPENIFLTGRGRFKLGDFGLAIKADEELPFSRSGTLDYMAPEVLRNPAVPFQEGRGVTAAALASRGVKPYGAAVDVWAAGVLAYELVCGRPPFEVEDEAQTAALIMYSDAVRFPPNRSAQWAEFVRAALVKQPEARPTAAALLRHPWVTATMQRALSERHRPSKEMLLQPLPLPAAMVAAAAAALGGGSGGGGGGAELKRTASLSGHSREPVLSAAAAGLAPLPTGGLPTGLAPALPAACPATPSGAGRLHHGGGGGGFASSEREQREREQHHQQVQSSAHAAAAAVAAALAGGSGGSGGSAGTGAGSSAGGSSVVSHSGSRLSIVTGSGGTEALAAAAVAAAAAAAGAHGGGSASGSSSLLTAAPPSPKRSGPSFSSGSGSGSGLSPLHLGSISASGSAGGGGGLIARSSSVSGSGGGVLGGLHSSSGGGGLGGGRAPLGLKISLPPSDAALGGGGGGGNDFDHHHLNHPPLGSPSGGGGGGSSLSLSGYSLDGSPATPVPRPGIKERMKFYFARQAGDHGGF